MTDSAPPPNILLITSDQHRADCLGVAGHPCISTPHLDQLAYEGTRFTNAYSNCPVCIPARTTMITGIDAHRNGMPAYNASHRVERNREDFLGSLVTAAGYQTQLVGKTHWHTDPSFRAGFENVIGNQTILSDQRRAWSGRPNLRGEGIGFNEMHPTLSQFPPELYSTDWSVDRAVEFLRYRDQTSPFFLWLSLTDPHPPLCIHEPYFSLYDDAEIPMPVMGDWNNNEAHCPGSMWAHRHAYNPGPMKDWELRKMRSVYYGMITNIDHQLGRLFGRLQLDGNWDNTWIIYTTDHGEHLGDYGDFAKSSFLNASARLPMIIRPPAGSGHRGGEQCDSLVELADLLPTICGVSNARVPEDVMGQDLLPLTREPGGTVRDFIHGQIMDQHMYLDRDYKYIYSINDGRELLFDVNADPQELRNLAGDHERLKQYRNRLLDHLVEEAHPHVKDGALLNLGRPMPSIQECRARNVAGMPPAGW